MGRIVCRALVLTVLLGLTGCGTEPKPAPSATPSISAPPAPEPSESESEEAIIEEEDVEPSDSPGDLSAEAQDNLDEALGIELGALAEKGERRPELERLPEDPTAVVAALKDYKWLSPQAKALYDKAAATS